MKLFSIILISLFSFKNCLNDRTNLYVVMDDANGLGNGSKVTCKGLEVGKINDIKIAGNKSETQVIVPVHQITDLLCSRLSLNGIIRIILPFHVLQNFYSVCPLIFLFRNYPCPVLPFKFIRPKPVHCLPSMWYSYFSPGRCSNLW